MPYTPDLVGWQIEWKSPFRTKRGTVVEETHVLTVLEDDVDEFIELPLGSKLTKIAPSVDVYLKYITQNSLKSDSLLSNPIENVKDPVVIQALKSRLKQMDRSERLMDGGTEGKDSHSDDDQERDEEEDDGGSDDDEDGEEEGSDEMHDDSSEGEEESSSEEENDEESEGSDEEEESSEEESSESDEEDEKLSIKVVICNEARLFHVRQNGVDVLSTILKKLKKEFKEQPRLYFTDADGDLVLLESKKDFKMALKSHLLSGSGEVGTPVMRLSAKLSGQQQQGLSSSGTADPNVLHSLDDFITVPFQQQSLEEKGSMGYRDKGLGSSRTKTRGDQRSFEGGSHSSGVRDSGEFSGYEGVVGGGAIEDDKGDDLFLWQRGECIGSGSFGEVFSGIDLVSGRRMAVKEVTVSAHGSGGKQQREQAIALQREVKLLNSLDHPNIIKYLGAEFTKKTLRIFLELAAEGSVKDALNQFGPFSESLLRRYTTDIVAGLHYLHSNRVIHRDIKPSNLLIDKNTIKIADFGCSTRSGGSVGLSFLDGGQTNMNEKDHGTIIGTTIYMSPEVMKGDEVGYGRKSDIWSLGVTLVEMATAKAPYRNAAAAIFSTCVSKTLPSMPDYCSPEAQAFLDRCLVETVKERASTKELLKMKFLVAQTSSEVRLQTSSFQTQRGHTASSVQLEPPTYQEGKEMDSAFPECEDPLADSMNDSSRLYEYGGSKESEGGVGDADVEMCVAHHHATASPRGFHAPPSSKYSKLQPQPYDADEGDDDLSDDELFCHSSRGKISEDQANSMNRMEQPNNMDQSNSIRSSVSSSRRGSTIALPVDGASSSSGSRRGSAAAKRPIVPSIPLDAVQGREVGVQGGYTAGSKPSTRLPSARDEAKFEEDDYSEDDNDYSDDSADWKDVFG